jgi:hypothetical protein
MATFTRMTSPQQRDDNVGAPDDEPDDKDRSDETDGPVFHGQNVIEPLLVHW